MSLVNNIKEIIINEFPIDYDPAFSDSEKYSFDNYIGETLYESSEELDEENSDGISKYDSKVYSYIYEEYRELLNNAFVEYFWKTIGDLEVCWAEFVDNNLSSDEDILALYEYGYYDNLEELLEVKDIDDIALNIAESLESDFQEEMNKEKSWLENDLESYDPALEDSILSLVNIDSYLNPDYVPDEDDELQL